MRLCALSLYMDQDVESGNTMIDTLRARLIALCARDEVKDALHRVLVWRMERLHAENPRLAKEL